MHGWFYSLQNYCSWTLSYCWNFCFKRFHIPNMSWEPSRVVVLSKEKNYHIASDWQALLKSWKFSSLKDRTNTRVVSWKWNLSDQQWNCGVSSSACLRQSLNDLGSSPSSTPSLYVLCALYMRTYRAAAVTSCAWRVHETCEASRKESAVPRVFKLAFTKSLVQPLSSILGHVT